MAKDIVHAHVAATSPSVCFSEMMCLQILVAKGNGDRSWPRQRASLPKLSKRLSPVSWTSTIPVPVCSSNHLSRTPINPSSNYVDEIAKEVGFSLNVEKFLRFQVGEKA